MDVDTDSVSTLSSMGPSIFAVGSVSSVDQKRKRKNAYGVFKYVEELSTGVYKCMICSGDEQIWSPRNTDSGCNRFTYVPYITEKAFDVGSKILISKFLDFSFVSTKTPTLSCIFMTCMSQF